MDEFRRLLANQAVFADMTPDEMELLYEIAEEVRFNEGQIIFKEGDPADSLHWLATGAVDLFGYLSGGIERVMMTIRPGGVVGALALFGQDKRPVFARAAEETTAFTFNRSDLNDLIDTSNGIGRQILRFLTNDIARRLHAAVESLRQNLEWTLEVSGVAALNLRQLIIDQAEISVDLVTGRRLTGTILKAEERETGFELFLSTAKGNIHFIPYHAIVDVSLQKQSVTSSLRMTDG